MEKEFVPFPYSFHQRTSRLISTLKLKAAETMRPFCFWYVFQGSYHMPKTGLWLARSEEMDPYSSPCITHSGSFHVLFRSFLLNAKPKTLSPKPYIPHYNSLHFSTPSFPANQRPENRTHGHILPGYFMCIFGT